MIRYIITSVIILLMIIIYYKYHSLEIFMIGIYFFLLFSFISGISFTIFTKSKCSKILLFFYRKLMIFSDKYENALSIDYKKTVYLFGKLLLADTCLNFCVLVYITVKTYHLTYNVFVNIYPLWICIQIIVLMITIIVNINVSSEIKKLNKVFRFKNKEK